MTKIVLPGDLTRQLAEAQNCVELCDATGNTIGFFTPAVELLEPTISAEELKRRENGPFYTTAQVLAHLRSI